MTTAPSRAEVDFGEGWRDKLIREFDDELGLQLDVIGDPLIFENINQHLGIIGH